MHSRNTYQASATIYVLRVGVLALKVKSSHTRLLDALVICTLPLANVGDSTSRLVDWLAAHHWFAAINVAM